MRDEPSQESRWAPPPPSTRLLKGSLVAIWIPPLVLSVAVTVSVVERTWTLAGIGAVMLAFSAVLATKQRQSGLKQLREATERKKG